MKNHHCRGHSGALPRPLLWASAATPAAESAGWENLQLPLSPDNTPVSGPLTPRSYSTPNLWPTTNQHREYERPTPPLRWDALCGVLCAPELPVDWADLQLQLRGTCSPT